jgi:CheY-like chemotaxis protein
MHGGTVVGASDGVGRGSRFTVRLPLLADNTDRSAPRPKARGVSTGEGVTSRKILLIEDNQFVAESLAAWLDDCGHQVRIAATGAAGLREAEAFRPELIFVDIGLPDMTGHETARKLRDMPAVEDAVLIAVTGYGQEDDRRRSREAGFDHHWIKPLTTEMLSELLESLEPARERSRGPNVKGRARRSPRIGGRSPARSRGPSA